MAKWLSRFLVFLMVVIVSISIGLTFYYFLYSEETFAFVDENGTGLISYTNQGEVIDIAIERNHPTAEAYSLVSSDESVLKFKEEAQDNVFRFEAVSGGKVYVELRTSNKDFNGMSMVIYVGNGTEENPFYIRNYTDLSNIGYDGVFTLSAHYQQTADIDMNVATTAWEPIASSSEKFVGSYNGNNHKILNLNVIQNLATDGTPSDVIAEGDTNLYANNNITTAGLFAQIGYTGSVTKLNFENANIKGYYDNAGVVAGINSGNISFVDVTNSTVETTKTNSFIGGITGTLYGDNGLYSAKIEYSSFNGKLTNGNFVGGIAGINKAGLIFNSYARGNITNAVDSAIIGGITGQNTFAKVATKDYKASVVSCYTTTTFTSTGADSKVGAIIGSNLNNDSSNIVVLKAETDKAEEYNRVYGNFYLYQEGLKGIGDQENSTSSYIANAILQSAFINVPSASLIQQMNDQEAEGQSAFNDELGLITYNYEGKYAVWDFNQLWDIKKEINNNYPFIRDDALVILDAIYDGGKYITPPSTPEDPTAPITFSQIQSMFAQDLADDGLYNSKYLIEKDIDLASQAWEPIGDKDNQFNGTFIMQEGKKIKNLKISNPANNYVGFFGYIGSEGKVINVTIEGIDISITEDKENLNSLSILSVGSIAGINLGQITDSQVLSSSTTGVTMNSIVVSYAKPSFATNIGGVVGYNFGKNALVSNSTSQIQIIAKDNQAKTLNIGGVAGLVSSNAAIFGSNFKGDIDASANNLSSTSTLTIGGVVGSLQNSSISKSTFSGSIKAESTISKIGGIAGIVEDDSVVYGSGANVAINGGKFVGGIVGELSLNDSTAEGVKESYATGSIYGDKVGGFASLITVGTIANCYNDCQLSGTTAAGYAYQIAYSNSSTYGVVLNCFSSASFDTTRGTLYWETSSKIRETTGWWDGSKKVGGYVKSSIYNTSKKGSIKTQKDSTNFLNFNVTETLGHIDYGNRSEESCKKASTFTNRGFDTGIWKLIDGQYPQLLNAAVIAE